MIETAMNDLNEMKKKLKGHLIEQTALRFTCFSQYIEGGGVKPFIFV